MALRKNKAKLQKHLKLYLADQAHHKFKGIKVVLSGTVANEESCKCHSVKDTVRLLGALTTSDYEYIPQLDSSIEEADSRIIPQFCLLTQKEVGQTNRTQC